ncbi:hypothetical protein KFE96_12330 [Kordiimonas sp. SCSIO 12603]|uniref:thiamine pyrophosphate-dependent enzyme n=1 Tax=Kordiimonas sp. SCSIO 12603 TaxID=2829596 RepID=UPI002103E861|nr:thiamine pyrophosphate-dependent enzyme [Kordiimonas sp. SCSIO 12603]UTW57623.1 hypothetical protein KFE96_12330 [Kordiimonas sp. SCSIO 12603]
MKRADAITNLVKKHPEAAFVFSNGLTAREAAHVADQENNFYMLHAMGEALSVGIGLAMSRPDLHIVVVDGDGNALMGLAATAMMPIENLTWYVLDNRCFETTGEQQTPEIPVKAPWLNIIPIDNGTIGAPNPPGPEFIMDRFSKWLEKKRTE